MYATATVTMLLSIVIVVVSINVVQTLCSNHFNISVSDDSITCAPWHYINPSNGMCKCCVSKKALIKCTDEGTLMRIGYCTTYTEGEGVSMVKCPYLKMKTLRHAYKTARNDPLYIVLPDNISELNDYMCGPMNRKGFLCSECIDGFSPSFTSRDYMACSNCTASRYYGVPLFILATFVPITLFYLTFLLFQINVTSSPMTCYIFYSQLMMLGTTSAVKSQLLKSNAYFFKTNFDLATYTLYGLWNLDFLRYSLPPFCVSSRLNHTNVTILGCVSVFYPLCLILLTITFVKLHDHNFKVVVCLWRPFHKCFTRIRRGWNTKSDIINVFATFLLLSYNKFFYLMISITEGTRVYSMNNDLGIVYTSRTLPYTNLGILLRNDKDKYLALSITLGGLALIITLLPAFLLVCYPIRLFQRFLSKLRLDCVFINIFVERFYSCYKDGLDGGRDMRSFAGFYFLLRYTLWFAAILSKYLSVSSPLRSITSQIFFCAAVLISLTRPYKRMYMTVLDVLLLCLLAAIFHLLSTDYTPTQGMITSVVVLIPAVVFWICFIFVASKRLTKLCIMNTQRRRSMIQEVTRYGTN